VSESILAAPRRPAPALHLLGGQDFFLPLLAALALLPSVVGGFWLYSLGLCFANSIGVIAVTVLIRYGGEVSIGHSVFVAAGAYAVAILEKQFGLSIAAGLPAALAIGAVLGILLAYPSRRLSGVYLAVTTMAIALALPEIILHAGPVAGGFEGLYVAGDLLPGVGKPLQHYYVALIVLAGVVLALDRLRHSRQGLALLTARSHKAAAEAFGITPDWARLSVMGLSGGLAGLSGAVLAFTSSTVSPNSFTLWSSIFLLVGSVVSVYGLSLVRALLGGMFLTLAPQVLAGAGNWIPVLYGAALLIVILGGHYAPRLRAVGRRA
jgi:branched-chain amino acid transport system permease protein